MNMTFTSAGPLNRWGTAATANSSVTNSRAVRRRASHKAYSSPVVLWAPSFPVTGSSSGGGGSASGGSGSGSGESGSGSGESGSGSAPFDGGSGEASGDTGLSWSNAPQSNEEYIGN